MMDTGTGKETEAKVGRRRGPEAAVSLSGRRQDPATDATLTRTGI